MSITTVPSRVYPAENLVYTIENIRSIDTSAYQQDNISQYIGSSWKVMAELIDGSLHVYVKEFDHTAYNAKEYSIRRDPINHGRIGDEGLTINDANKHLYYREVTLPELKNITTKI